MFDSVFRVGFVFWVVFEFFNCKFFLLVVVIIVFIVVIQVIIFFWWFQLGGILFLNEVDFLGLNLLVLSLVFLDIVVIVDVLVIKLIQIFLYVELELCICVFSVGFVVFFSFDYYYIFCVKCGFNEIGISKVVLWIFIRWEGFMCVWRIFIRIGKCDFGEWQGGSSKKGVVEW